nr:unnamed protein product [Digitaria exilis]
MRLRRPWREAPGGESRWPLAEQRPRAVIWLADGPCSLSSSSLALRRDPAAHPVSGSGSSRRALQAPPGGRGGRGSRPAPPPTAVHAREAG